MAELGPLDVPGHGLLVAATGPRSRSPMRRSRGARPGRRGRPRRPPVAARAGRGAPASRPGTRGRGHALGLARVRPRRPGRPRPDGARPRRRGGGRFPPRPRPGRPPRPGAAPGPPGAGPRATRPRRSVSSRSPAPPTPTTATPSSASGTPCGWRAAPPEAEPPLRKARDLDDPLRPGPARRRRRIGRRRADFSCGSARALRSPRPLPEARGWYNLAVAVDPLNADAQKALYRLGGSG